MLIYGHRGAAGEAPENTIAGFKHTVARGVDRVELDLQLSADAQLVVMHDGTVNRTCDARGKVRKFTARELAAMDARQDGPPWPRKRDAGVPTLEKLLASVPEIKHYQLEIKPASRREQDTVAQLLAARFPSALAARGIVITSSDTYLQKAVASAAPHLPRGLVSVNADALAVASGLGCKYAILHYSLVTKALLSQARKHGLDVSVWTVNDVETIKRLYKLKVHSVITDYPSMAVPYLGSLMR